MNSLLLLALAAVVILLLWRRYTQSASNATVAEKRKPSAKTSADFGETNFRATVIVPGREACDAAKLLADKPFLVAEHSTPPLPLPNCTAPRCRCKYEHREDRREDDMGRRLEIGMQQEIYRVSGAEERRGSRGRRKQDASGGY